MKLSEVYNNIKNRNIEIYNLKELEETFLLGTPFFVSKVNGDMITLEVLIHDGIKDYEVDYEIWEEVSLKDLNELLKPFNTKIILKEKKLKTIKIHTLSDIINNDKVASVLKEDKYVILYLTNGIKGIIDKNILNNKTLSVDDCGVIYRSGNITISKSLKGILYEE